MEDSDWFPAVDVSETDREYLFEFDLPGMGRDEFQMSVGSEAVCLTGVRATLRHGGKAIRSERPAGGFIRRLVLPANCRCNDIQATLQDGVLQLHIPKNTAPERNGTPCAAQFQEPEPTHC